MHRRDFLKCLGFATGASLLPLGGAAAFADGGVPAGLDPSHRFVFVYFDGGWDITMSLDPRDPAQYNTPYNGIQLAWDRLGAYGAPGLVRPNGSAIAFGPTMVNLARHYDQACVVRGMSMDTLTHEVGRRFFLTGKPPAGMTARGSSHGANAVDQLSKSAPAGVLPVANLVIDAESYYEGSRTEARPFRVGASNTLQLLFAFREGVTDPPAILEDQVLRWVNQPKAANPALRPLEAYRAQAGLCDPEGLDRRGGILSSYRASQAKARANVAARLGDHFDPGKADFAAVLARYGAAPASPGMVAAIGYQALRHGVSNCVTMRIQSGLDTHTVEWSTEQPRRQREAFDALATLLDDLKAPDAQGNKLIDRTTVVLFSEFSRTPLLNGAGGRDHSLTNACMLLGKGVPKNRVVGASSTVGMSPQSIDAQSGLPSTATNAVVLRPQQVMASVFQANGYDPTQFQTQGIPCLMG